MSKVIFPGEKMGEVVFFGGTRSKGKVDYLVFRVRNPNSNKFNPYQEVEVPVPKHISDLVMAHLQRVAVPESKPVERGNDEDSL